MQVFYVNIGGGEPTVRPDFWELVDYATAHHVGVKFSTNGVRLDAAAAARLAASDYVDVQISLDGATREVNDAVRGPGRSTRRCGRWGTCATRVRRFKLSVVMTRQNIPQIDEFKAIADEYGAQLRLTRLRPSGRGADVWDELHPLPAQQRELYDWLVAHGEQVLTGDSFFHLSAFGSALPGLNLCGAGRVVCLIDPVGDVYACPFAIHEDFLAGNVRDRGRIRGRVETSELFAELRRPDTGRRVHVLRALRLLPGRLHGREVLHRPAARRSRPGVRAGLRRDGPGRGVLSPVAAPRSSVDHSHRTAPARGAGHGDGRRPAGRAGAGVDHPPPAAVPRLRREPAGRFTARRGPAARPVPRPGRGQAASPGRPGEHDRGSLHGAYATRKFRSAGSALDGGPGDPGVPAGIRLAADPGTRLVAGGSVLVGGSPVRVLRLTPPGRARSPPGSPGRRSLRRAAARALARRLLDAGIAHPDFAGRGARPGHPARASSPAPADVTVVIPVRDRHAELGRCLAGLRGLPRVIVVDDASADPLAVKRIAAAHGAAVIRRPVNGGPGAARNTGLAAADTDVVAFLDSDCVPRPGWLDGLLPHFTDPAVGAVAPRIVPASAGTGWLARYKGASSTLDMGARPSVVRPGARVPYVPGAALVVRRGAAGSGFREGMYVGEDVDFVWRMAAAGWRVRYEPAAVMGHDHRVRFRAWFARRADYGTSAAALERLHPGAVRPLYASWWTAGAWAAALSGRPVTAAALTAAAAALLARRLSRVTGERWPVPGLPARAAPARCWGLAVRLAGGGPSPPPPPGQRPVPDLVAGGDPGGARR